MKKLFVLFLFAGLLLFGCAQPAASATGDAVKATAQASIAATAQATATPDAMEKGDGVLTGKQEAAATPTAAPEASASIQATADATPSVQEFTVTARQFDFEPATITVKKGVPVKLVITSQDVEHGFSIPEFNVNQKLPAGEAKTVEFTPDKTGEFTFFCSVFCGTNHGSMRGKLVVTD